MIHAKSVIIYISASRVQFCPLTDPAKWNFVYLSADRTVRRTCEYKLERKATLREIRMMRIFISCPISHEAVNGLIHPGA